ncbi:MAG: Uma2 family endonuclease [Chloroflexi bacterium]|nr:Uma2 family endonuclease [Chloroflexota bacterium]
MVAHLVRWQFTVDDYHRMAQAGILGEDDRVELIEGEVVKMTPIGRRHASCVIRTNETFVKAFNDVAAISVQNPVVLDQYTEPQPDFALLRRQPDFYASRLPTPADVYLLVEISDKTVEADRRVKVPLYAKSHVTEVWLVDVEQETITVYRDPSPDGYRTARVARRGEHIAPLAFSDRPIAVSDVLG